ncbi:MAG TPA: hypothetical protein VNF68_13730 [Candidatus Baltobacteraceae bacterium]|nr:hypothetical protein [Candidatus Baltobacteraceae bacterium]
MLALFLALSALFGCAGGVASGASFWDVRLNETLSQARLQLGSPTDVEHSLPGATSFVFHRDGCATVAFARDGAHINLIDEYASVVHDVGSQMCPPDDLNMRMEDDISKLLAQLNWIERVGGITRFHSLTTVRFRRNGVLYRYEFDNSKLAFESVSRP